MPTTLYYNPRGDDTGHRHTVTLDGDYDLIDDTWNDSGAWQKWDANTRAVFQMEQDCLCMPFGEFHKAVEEALGRPVWSHEFVMNRDGILAEMQGKAKAPSFADILALLPADRTVVVTA